RRFRPPERLLLVADALGLAVFSISGAQIAERAGLNGVTVVLMGTLTGAAGGVIRDVLTAEIPMILRRGQIYATASIAGVIIYQGLQAMSVGRPGAALVGMGSVFAVRLAAIVWGITLPVFTVQDSDGEP